MADAKSLDKLIRQLFRGTLSNTPAARLAFADAVARQSDDLRVMQVTGRWDGAVAAETGQSFGQMPRTPKVLMHLAGSMLVHSGDPVRRLRRGDVLAIEAGTAYHEQVPRRASATNLILLAAEDRTHFHVGRISPGQRARIALEATLHGDRARQLSQLIMTLTSLPAAAFEEQRPARRITGAMLELLVIAVREDDTVASVRGPLPVVIARRVMEEEFANPDLTIAQIARRVEMHPNALSTLYRKQTGHTLIGTLTEIRIRAAQRLLLEGNRQVGDIARAVGFGHHAHFSQVFKRLTGSTPRQFRRLGTEQTVR